MSVNIWTHCAGPSEIGPRTAVGHRVVEAQHENATRKLVDSDDEQALLEALIDSHAKPPMPPGERFSSLHYLLVTPFRHPPLRNGSRFGRRHERGIWYGSCDIRTALCEVAYYRLIFLEGTTANLGLQEVTLSAFKAKIAATRAIDLTQAPFDVFREELCSPTDYRAAQTLGSAMRSAGVEAFFFRSARYRREATTDESGTNLALFEPVFAGRTPTGLSSWRCSYTKERVEFRRNGVLTKPERHVFLREQFLVEGALPHPAT